MNNLKTNLLRRFILQLLLSIGMLVCKVSFAACPNSKVLTEGFYRQDYSFSFKDPSNLYTPFTDNFKSLLVAEFKCKSKGDSCRIDWDPWTDAQDGDIVGQPIIKLISENETDASVRVFLKFKFDPLKKPRSISAIVLLKRSNRESCWKVDDFETPSHRSLVEYLH